MAGEPSNLVGQQQLMENAEDSDLDAEGEEDIATYHTASVSAKEVDNGDSDGEDPDAEGEDDEDAEGEDDDEIMGITNVAAIGVDDDDDEDAAADSDSDVKSDIVASDAESDAVTESDPENAWQGESDTAEEVETEIVDPNQCM
jgi:histone acetyltransferase SAS3